MNAKILEVTAHAKMEELASNIPTKPYMNCSGILKQTFPYLIITVKNSNIKLLMGKFLVHYKKKFFSGYGQLLAIPLF